jgi:hypothetical protein
VSPEYLAQESDAAYKKKYLQITDLCRGIQKMDACRYLSQNYNARDKDSRPLDTEKDGFNKWDLLVKGIIESHCILLHALLMGVPYKFMQLKVESDIQKIFKYPMAEFPDVHLPEAWGKMHSY